MDLRTRACTVYTGVTYRSYKSFLQCEGFAESVYAVFEMAASNAQRFSPLVERENFVNRNEEKNQRRTKKENRL